MQRNHSFDNRLSLALIVAFMAMFLLSVGNHLLNTGTPPDHTTITRHDH